MEADLSARQSWVFVMAKSTVDKHIMWTPKHCTCMLWLLLHPLPAAALDVLMNCSFTCQELFPISLAKEI